MSEWTPIAPFFVTARHGKRQPIFRGETTANLLIETRAHDRALPKFLLHEFVLMRDQVHTLLTPAPESTFGPCHAVHRRSALSRPSKGRVTRLRRRPGL